MSNYPNIFLGPIPPGASRDVEDQMTARRVLDGVARLVEYQIKAVAGQWKMYRDNAPRLDRSMAERKAVYDGLNCAIGCIQQEWERRGFAGNVLRQMPPTDGYDENGNERLGVADYCKILDADIPY